MPSDFIRYSIYMKSVYVSNFTFAPNGRCGSSSTPGSGAALPGRCATCVSHHDAGSNRDRKAGQDPSRGWASAWPFGSMGLRGCCHGTAPSSLRGRGRAGRACGLGGWSRHGSGCLLGIRELSGSPPGRTAGVAVFRRVAPLRWLRAGGACRGAAGERGSGSAVPGSARRRGCLCGAWPRRSHRGAPPGFTYTSRRLPLAAGSLGCSRGGRGGRGSPSCDCPGMECEYSPSAFRNAP